MYVCILKDLVFFSNFIYNWIDTLPFQLNVSVLETGFWRVQTPLVKYTSNGTCFLEEWNRTLLSECQSLASILAATQACRSDGENFKCLYFSDSSFYCEPSSVNIHTPTPTLTFSGFKFIGSTPVLLFLRISLWVGRYCRYILSW